MCTDSGTPIRILLVHDQAVIRAGLHALIESWPGLAVVSEAGTCPEAVAMVGSEQPDIILLDLDFGGSGNGVNVLSELSGVVSDSRVIVLTDGRDPEVRVTAVRLGATGVISKHKTAADLRKAIEKVHQGEAWLDRSLTADIIAEMSRRRGPDKPDPEVKRIESLTDRERQVAVLVCEGLQNKEIAERLFISDTTVRHHLTSIFSKLELTNRFELVIFLYRHKIVQPPA